MPSPFPGMDPYLEEPGLWPDFLNTAYDRAAYDLAVDYRREPVPPLNETQQRWAHTLLQDNGVRG